MRRHIGEKEQDMHWLHLKLVTGDTRSRPAMLMNLRDDLRKEVQEWWMLWSWSETMPPGITSAALPSQLSTDP